MKRFAKILLSAVLAVSCVLGTTGCSGVKSSVGNVEEMVFADGDKIAEITIEGYGTIKAKLYPEVAPNGVNNFIMLAEQGYYDGLKIHRVIEDFMMQGGSLNGDGTGGTALINNEGQFGIEVNNDLARHYYGALCYANAMGQNSTQFYIVNNKQPQDLSTIDTTQIQTAAAAYLEMAGQFESGTDGYNYYEFQSKYYTNMATAISKATDEVKEKYLTEGGTPSLDGNYTVFGQVFEGFEIIDAIATVDKELGSDNAQSKPVEDIIISSVVITEYVTPGTGEAEEEDTSNNSANDTESTPANGEDTADSDATTTAPTESDASADTAAAE